MTEKFALRERLGHSAAMHGDEGEAAALLVEAVDGTGEYLFSRAGLALQQHGGVADLSCFVGTLQHRIHVPAVGNKAQPTKYVAKLLGTWYRLRHVLFFRARRHGCKSCKAIGREQRRVFICAAWSNLAC